MDSTKTFLILKYGSLEAAYGNWVRSKTDFFTVEERKVVAEHYGITEEVMYQFRERQLEFMKEFGVTEKRYAKHYDRN